VSRCVSVSHVLAAMGIPPEKSHGAVRMSFGRENTEEDVDKLIDVLPGVVENLRSFSPIYKDFLRQQTA